MTLTNNLPAALRKSGRFCCWRYEERDGKRTKVPYNPRTGGKAQSTNPDTFAPLDTAEAVQSQYDGMGVGIFDRLGAIDIDHCISEAGELSPMAADIMETMGAYAESSPSGYGMRILFTVPEGFAYDKARYYINNQKAGLEVYIAGSTNKFVTVTGDTFTPGKDLEERGEQLQAVLEKFMQRPVKNRPTQIDTGNPAAVDLDDLELINRAKRSKQGAAFAALMAGDITGYKSQSEADIALCNMLAFWTNRDAARMDRIFRTSGLMREKWDRRQSGSTYGAITVQSAIDTAQQGYEPTSYNVDIAPQNGGLPPDWTPAIPFDTIEPPNFPVDELPGPMDAFVEALAESTQTPEEMAGVLSLGTLATAFQTRYEARITPDWKEPLCLYTAAIAPSGERKSSVISALNAPIYEYEAERQRDEAAEIAQNRTERALLEKALTEAQKRATTGRGDFNACRDEALALSAKLAEFKDKHPFRLMTDDTTPEKLADIMEKHNDSTTIASAEGGIFDTLNGRYDKAVNLDIYLKGHSGDAIKIDRIGRPGNYMSRPKLSMILTVQPEVLAGLMSNATMKAKGFCGRFLYAMCKSKVGRRKVSPPPVPETVRMEYRRFMRRILSGTGSGEIRLSPAADEIRREYQAHIEKKLGNEWEHMRDWGGKIVGQTVRIAALMHAAEVGDPVETPISEETMRGAVKIAECLSLHAEAAYQIMGADETQADAKYLWRRIEKLGLPEISKRDLFAKCQSKFERVEKMDPALAILKERGYVRIEEKQTGGRSSTRILANPLAVKP